MHVVATAGHVDHGKSTLVRALTGMEPDRWAEERRRGMTIDLGFAWTSLPGGQVVGFVDVPGHQRFLGNMLAGLGPSPAVLFVVAADEGWCRQSAEHLAAIDGLGLTHGLLVVTRTDLADPGPAAAEALAALGSSSLGTVPVVAASGLSRAGLPELRVALGDLVSRLPVPDPTAPVRLWVDRAFTIRGAGTVVTGTLAAGRLRVGDALQLGERTVRVRGLQSLGQGLDEVASVARVAVNLRGVERDEVARGDVLLSGHWHLATALDVRLTTDRVPEQQQLHLGTASLPVRVRELGPGVARLLLPVGLPVRAGDRALLRDPAGQRISSGVTVLDADPPPLTRRGAAARRALDLGSRPDLLSEVARRGAVTAAALTSLGIDVVPTAGVREVAGWLVTDSTWEHWGALLCAAVDQPRPLETGLTDQAACHAVGLPAKELLPALVALTGLEQHRGRVLRPGAVPDLGAAEPAVRVLEERLGRDCFDAPRTTDLQGLSRKHLAAAVTAGRLLVLGDVVLGPSAVGSALTRLVGAPTPFTVAQARSALGCRRPVAVAVLEHLDDLGLTVRRPGGVRELVSAPLVSAPLVSAPLVSAPLVSAPRAGSPAES